MLKDSCTINPKPTVHDTTESRSIELFNFNLILLLGKSFYFEINQSYTLYFCYMKWSFTLKPVCLHLIKFFRFHLLLYIWLPLTPDTKTSPEVPTAPLCPPALRQLFNWVTKGSFPPSNMVQFNSVRYTWEQWGHWRPHHYLVGGERTRLLQQRQTHKRRDKIATRQCAALQWIQWTHRNTVTAGNNGGHPAFRVGDIRSCNQCKIFKHGACELPAPPTPSLATN